jgi:hypothetical protein
MLTGTSSLSSSQELWFFNSSTRLSITFAEEKRSLSISGRSWIV